MQDWKYFKNTRYMVSGEGNVFSTYTNKILKTTDDGHGYACVTLWIDGISEKYKVHRLVAECFLDNPENLIEVNHKDGNKTNNLADNLEWVTRRENMLHAWKNNLMRIGSDCVISKLDEKAVEQIKLMFIQGLSNQDIAEKFNVARGTVSKIRQLKTWKHVRPDLVFEDHSVTKNSGSKLSVEDIPIIRRMYTEGYSLSEIGRKFNVHSGTISGVISGRSYRNY